MEPKKYRAKTIQAAVNLIKDEIGPDAMILSTKRLPKSVRDPYSANLFEVTAVSPEHFRNSELKSKNKLKDVFKKHQKSYFEREKDLDRNNSDKDYYAIKAELNEIKDMVYLYSQGENFSGLLQTNPEYLNLYGSLIKSGLSDARARMFIENVDFGDEYFDGGKKSSLSEDFTRSVLREIHSSIKVTNPFEMNKGERCLAAFIGPTGVGKTTTIAKIAADLHLKQKKNIGLISIDNYRIGALEQLKAYASIMGVPCLPAFSSEDFQAAVRKMQNREIILIDTAGHSHLDEKRMRELMLYMSGNQHISSHLVLSSTTDRFDMKDAAKSFSILNPESFIFTKLDETRRGGLIVDQAIDMNLPISFLTNGQKVPDDLKVATPKTILKMVFGMNKKNSPVCHPPDTNKKILDKIYSKQRDSFVAQHVS